MYYTSIQSPKGHILVCDLIKQNGMHSLPFMFLQNVVHELRITNQVIYLNPPIEDCRYKLFQELFAWKMVILSLPRIQSQRYQVRRKKYTSASKRS